MGAGASAATAAFKAGIEQASPDELEACVGSLDAAALQRLQAAVAAAERTSAAAQEAADPVGYKKRQLAMAASSVCRLKGDQLESILEGYDPTKELDKEEFSALWTKLGFSSTFMEGYFKAMDTDGSGKISYQQLLGGLAAASQEDVDATAALLLKVYDTNGNGTLCKDEFVATVTNAVKVMKAGMEASINSIADDAVEMLNAAAVLQEATGACTGETNETNNADDAIVPSPPPTKVTKDDLVAQLFADMPELTVPSQEEIDGMFKEIDCNEDGQICVAELKKLMLKDSDNFTFIFQPTKMSKAIAEQMEGQFAMGMMAGATGECSVM